LQKRKVVQWDMGAVLGRGHITYIAIAAGFVPGRHRRRLVAPSGRICDQPFDRRTLGECLVASPALIRKPLSSPSDLSGLPSLDPGPMHRDHQWQLHHKDGQTALIPHRPRLVTDDIAVLREATLAGVGVVQLPTVMICEDIRAGRLVHVLPQWQPRSGIVHAVFPSRRGLLPSVRALLDFLARECAVRRQLVSGAAS
jgi:DNA-binding transcriptional LysR family regulator